MSLEKAIELLREEYEKAKTQEWILNPLGWAFYQTWKRIDEEK